jgi:hypothetical protein
MERRAVELELSSPAGGEVILALPGRVLSATAGHHPVSMRPVPRQARARPAGKQARLLLGAGEHRVVVRWR